MPHALYAMVKPRMPHITSFIQIGKSAIKSLLVKCACVRPSKVDGVRDEVIIAAKKQER